MNPTTVPARFVVWREVVSAYVAPAVCAGAGGLITGQEDLLRAAVTSIAGTSALVAFLLGMWLRQSGVRVSRLRRARPVSLAAGFGLGAAALAALTAQLLTATALFPDRIRIDFPIAAALAATIITWRWCSVQRKAHG
ncbi:hypothetical protein [Nocardia aurantiaca]|uniref:Uncharacterized protein n=1 Tax=Nocardia aurantiaca TaxID=2675850 RepID=A0A6I3L535_9NOCA|nr:hypothetical protein [Nocardia aurantiaca]MTE16070.1 hypothetical protein [Nocardia aurantiaca]